MGYSSSSSSKLYPGNGNITSLSNLINSSIFGFVKKSNPIILVEVSILTNCISVCKYCPKFLYISVFKKFILSLIGL